MRRELSRSLLKTILLQIASDRCRRKMTLPLCASMQQEILALESTCRMHGTGRYEQFDPCNLLCFWDGRWQISIASRVGSASWHLDPAIADSGTGVPGEYSSASGPWAVLIRRRLPFMLQVRIEETQQDRRLRTYPCKQQDRDSRLDAFISSRTSVPVLSGRSYSSSAPSTGCSANEETASRLFEAEIT
jgi:hypothetical protein